jgi:hypothetical protein
VGEWLNPAVLKTVRPERVSGVRIPPPPPSITLQPQFGIGLDSPLRYRGFPISFGMRRGDFSLSPAPVFWRKSDTPKPVLWFYKLNAQFGFFALYSFLVHHAALRLCASLFVSQEDGRLDFDRRCQHQRSAVNVHDRRARFLAKRLPVHTLTDDFHWHIDCYPRTSARGGIC